ncbi:hypothetical protein QTH90_30245 [Variovorax sp. J2P1-59]|uniref:hypothetical protein n=1 Tax=Variovorax flavidus TaxID=3053501 RepID=UPI00257851B1|nr:hypothetical protein [Variovorax sp. J2P1-59]MDM0078721.1 hypothetical protein [Variovorax sp. J2P1-59]
MHFVTVKVDRVFGVERRMTTKTGKFSTFGFEIAGKKFYGLEAWDWPPIDSGMTITAALARPDDMSSLRGWYDHRTGQVVSPSPRGLQWLACVLWLLLAAMVLGLPALGYRSTAPAGAAWLLGAALVGSAFWLHTLHHRYKTLRAELYAEGARQRYGQSGT